MPITTPKFYRSLPNPLTGPVYVPGNVARTSTPPALEFWINLDDRYAVVTDTYPGSVNSVALTMPTGFSIAGSPVTESGTLAVTNTFTAGSVVFAMGTGFAQDNANFFWDNTNNRLGLLTALPTMTFSIAELFKVDSTGNAYFVNDTQFIQMNDIKIHGYGTNNFFAGASAGNFTLTSSNCVGIGNNAGLGLTSGTGNVFIGRQAGQSVTIGVDSVIIGRQAGDDLITGSRCIIIGSATDAVPYNSATSDSINIGNVIIGDRVTRSVKFGDVENVAGSLTQAEACAILELESVTKGFIPPKMTTAQRDAISSPVAGLLIYNTSTNKLNVYTTAWEQITSA